MEARLLRIKELIELKEKTDAELEQLIGGGPVRSSKARICSVCNSEGHTARNCPTKETETS